MKVNCWCEATVVSVAAADVKLGLTHPCKAEGCIKMDKVQRRRVRAQQTRVDL